MAVAGVIAGIAVISDSATLLVGAMAISPDLYPITATCTGLVHRRRRLVRRGLGTLVLDWPPRARLPSLLRHS